MSENLYNYTQLVNEIEKIVENKLNQYGLLQTEFRLGKVDTVTSTKKLMVFVDGASTSQPVPCNPDVTFVSGDEVLVIAPRGNKSKYVLAKRGI